MFVIRLLASAFTALTLSAAEGVIRVGESSVDIDIHLPVTGNAFERVLGANRYLNEQLRNSEVDFVHTDVPHVTLYLTSFSCPKNSTVGTGGSRTSDDLQSGLTATNCIELISNAVNSTVHSLAQSFGPCDVYITNSFAAGSFAMANVSLSPCLQTYSDAVVNATYQFIQSNQTVPSWVHDLPEPERSEKIALVQEYGSPNVFSQFQVRLEV